MNREEYKNTEDYKIALTVVRDFIETTLNGNTDLLINNDITQLINRIDDKEQRSTYFGNINDPDMYYITQAIYIVVWGHIYNLTFDKMGSWGAVKHPFRGDTMNSFNSIFGKDMLIANRYNPDAMLRKEIEEFYHLYHSIGNFILIPNNDNLNSKRANYFTIQDYFDSFLGALYQYRNPNEETEYRCFCNELSRVFSANEEYAKEGFDFHQYVSDFFLECYLKNDKPVNVFDIPYEVRKKEYIGRARRSRTDFITDEEYRNLAFNYCRTAKGIVTYRAEKMVEILNREIHNH